MIDPKWIALINYCNKNPYCTIEKLEVAAGVPVVAVIEEKFTGDTRALIKIKL